MRYSVVVSVRTSRAIERHLAYGAYRIEAVQACHGVVNDLNLSIPLHRIAQGLLQGSKPLNFPDWRRLWPARFRDVPLFLDVVHFRWQATFRCQLFNQPVRRHPRRRLVSI